MASRSILAGFSAYKFKVVVCLGITESILRTIFLLSTFIYNSTADPKIQVFLNDEVDFILCVLFFTIWLSEFIAGLSIFYLEERQLLLVACKMSNLQEGRRSFGETALD